MAGNLVLKSIRAGLDLLFPPLCLHCRVQVAQPGFCPACWSAIAFLDGPGCACCGLPFPVALEGENLCAACLVKPPAFDSARAILAYDDKSRGAILALKHADRLDLVPGFARWLSRVGRGALENSDLVIPVPLHPFRLWRRRYNQAAELARRLGRDWNLAYAPAALLRSWPHKAKAPCPAPRPGAAMCSRLFRFPIPAWWRENACFWWMTCLTTGATVEACARALKRAGAAKVHVLVLARVVKAADVII